MPTQLKFKVVSTVAVAVFAFVAWRQLRGTLGGPAHLHPGAAPGPEGIEVPAGGTTLTMQEIGGRPMVDVTINGKGPYRFILDTGASITVIDTALNRELSLPAAAGVTAAPTSPGEMPPIVTIREIRVGDTILRGVMAAVMPLSRLLKGGNAPHGVLSATQFPGYLLAYDYPAQRISIEKGELGDAGSEGTFEYPPGGLPTVVVRIGGREARVDLDTGSGGGLTLPTRYLKELSLASQPKEAGKSRLLTGEFPILKAQVNGPIELGKYKLDLSEVTFSDERPGKGPPNGNIGYQALRSFKVTLDTKNRRIRFVR